MKFNQLKSNATYRVLDDRLAPHEYTATGAEIVEQVTELGWLDDGDYQIEEVK